jgi:hypothetical protein
MPTSESETALLNDRRGEDADALHPWQRVTRGSGLTLHAAAREPVHAPTLRQEFTRLDAAVGPAGRTFLANDGSWAAIPLIERSNATCAGTPGGSEPTPALAHMPAVQALLAQHDWTVLSVYVLRQPPYGTLPWHFDQQALHLSECRLLLPICAPPGAVTWIGHDPAAYPDGTLWTADFSFPHQVDNPTGAQRVVLAIDVDCNQAVRRLLPEALAAASDRRLGLAQTARNLLLQWRARQR